MTAYIIINLICWVLSALLALHLSGKGQAEYKTGGIVFSIIMALWSLLLLL